MVQTRKSQYYKIVTFFFGIIIAFEPSLSKYAWNRMGIDLAQYSREISI